MVDPRTEEVADAVDRLPSSLRIWPEAEPPGENL